MSVIFLKRADLKSAEFNFFRNSCQCRLRPGYGRGDRDARTYGL